MVKTGPWIFGRKVMLPAGVVSRVDVDAERVHVVPAQFAAQLHSHAPMATEATSPARAMPGSTTSVARVRHRQSASPLSVNERARGVIMPHIIRGPYAASAFLSHSRHAVSTP